MPKRTEFNIADLELGRYIRHEYAALRKLGYPMMAAFAREIARGTISLPPPTAEDPVMEVVGQFYSRLMLHEKRIMFDKYLGAWSAQSRAKNMGISTGRLQRKINRVLERLERHLMAHGMLGQAVTGSGRVVLATVMVV